MKRLLQAGALFVLLVGSVYGWLVYKNNRAMPAPEQATIRQSYDQGVQWLLANEDRVLREQNPMLWWMIEQSAQLTHDSRLMALYTKYLASRAPDEARSVAQMFVEPVKFWGANIPEYAYANYDAYQTYFLFGISCSLSFVGRPEIELQKELDYCDKHDSTPACLTHQLMAFRFMQRYGCDRITDLPERIAASQDRILTKLQHDPRVIDAYIQRVLMLVDSGAAARVKPVWVNQILHAQLPDGSWPGKQPLIRIGSFTLSFADLWWALYPGEVRGTFHATAQGVWLTSLLQQQDTYAAFAASGKR